MAAFCCSFVIRLKCLLRTHLLGVAHYSFADFEGALRPHLEVVSSASFFLGEGVASCEWAKGVVSLLKAEVALTEGFIFLVGLLTGLSYELEAG